MLNRCDETRSLIRRPLTFALLSLIALRVRWNSEINHDGLEIGQAFIGDFSAFGATHQQYRTALDQLVKWGYIHKQTTNKGTIVTLLNQKIYDCNIRHELLPPNKPTTSQPRATNKRSTTNKKIEGKEENKQQLPPSNPQRKNPVIDLARSIVASKQNTPSYEMILSFFKKTGCPNPDDTAASFQRFGMDKNWASTSGRSWGDGWKNIAMTFARQTRKGSVPPQLT